MSQKRSESIDQSVKPELPHWDLTALYPSIESAACKADFDRVVAAVEQLGELFDRLDVGKPPTGDCRAALVQDLERAVNALNDIEVRLHSLTSYLYEHITTDSHNELAQARFSELQVRTVSLETLQKRFTAWMGSLPVDDLIEASALLAAHAFPLRRLRVSARHLMSPDEEALVAELAPSAGNAWGKLHTTLTSQIMVPLTIEGEARSLPMSQARNLATDRDREVRRLAWEAELEGWSANAVPIAAALNGVKG